MFGFGKRARFVLLIGDAGALLAGYGAAKDDPLFAVSGDDVARQRLLTRLAATPTAPVRILYNGAAQEFRSEILPPVNLFDRHKILHRRLRQSFPHLQAAACRMVGGRQALLAGLHENAACNFWLHALAPERLSLGLLPVECAALGARFAPDKERGWIMLLAPFQTGGLRQIVTRHGRLVFTRQTATISDTDPRRMAAELARLVEDSRAYLARFGLTDGADLRVVCIVDPKLTAALAAEIGQLPSSFAPLLLSPEQAAGIAGFDQPSTFMASDLLFAAFPSARPVLEILPAALRHKRGETKLARRGMRFAIAVMMAALAVNAVLGAETGLRLYRDHRAGREIAVMRQNLVTEETSIAPLAEPLGRLRAALERQRLFSEPQPQPWNVLRLVGRETGGAARLTSLDWHDDGALHVDLRLIGDDAPDREAVLKRFRGIAIQLAAAMPGYKIDIARYPFPALPGDALTNAGDTENIADASAGFTIKGNP